MKAQEIVAEIAKSQEYGELVEFWELVHNDSSPETAEFWGRIYELLRVLEEIIDAKRKAFLRKITGSYGKKTEPNKIYFGMKNVDDAWDAFNKQVNQQMPIYIQLMDLMTNKTQAEKQKEEAQEEIPVAVI